ncbi:MAG: M20/M25/M40 family metallo-hydrolase, partial [Sphingomonadales bacterium]|nr:M20/M25/M40 family metallo-hydrolase [Sphingomonadales bacterium]
PTQSSDSVLKTLTRLAANKDVSISRVDDPTPSDPSPLRPDVLEALDATLMENWGSLPIVPTMSTGATDGLYVRNAGIPVYGVGGLFIGETDGNAHGRDERIQTESFKKAIDHWDGLLRRLTGGKK